MLKLLKETWSITGTYGDRDNDQSYGYYWHSEQWQFNTATLQVVRVLAPNAGYYTQDQGSGATDPGPTDFYLPLSEQIHSVTNGRTFTGYFHDGDGGFRRMILTQQLTRSICYGGNNGELTVLVSGELLEPYEYLWDDGTTTPQRGLVANGSYGVRVTHPETGASCFFTAQAVQNPEISVLVQKAGKNVTLEASGGIAPYSYAWEDGATTATRLNLPGGSYLCTITDALGCRKQVLVTIDAYQFFWSRNPITLPLDAGDEYRLDPTTKPGLSFLCEVWVELDYLSGEFVPVGTTLEQPADRDGRTVFSVQSLLHVFLQEHVPAPGLSTVERADPMFRRFYLKYAESYGQPPVRSATAILEQNYVVLGGLDFYEARARTWFNSYQNDVRPFLTWEPPVKYVLSDQPEFLYYMAKQPAAFQVQVRVRFSDGTTLLQELEGPAAVEQHEVYCLPAGYQALRLGQLVTADRKVTAWEVSVVAADGTAVLSETRTFLLDTRVFPVRRYFLYATSLGGMATFAALGQTQLDLEVTGEESALVLDVNYEPLQGDTTVQTRSLRPVLKVASGPRTRAQMIVAQDLLLSRRVLLLNGPQWLPGYIKTKSTTLLDESKGVPTLDFEFYLPRQQQYTPRLGAGQVTANQLITQQP